MISVCWLLDVTRWPVTLLANVSKQWGANSSIALSVPLHSVLIIHALSLSLPLSLSLSLSLSPPLLSKQRRATRKEVRELEELVESELKDARTTLNIQVRSNYLTQLYTRQTWLPS